MMLCYESGTHRVSTNKCQTQDIMISFLAFVAGISAVHGSIACNSTLLNDTQRVIVSDKYDGHTCQMWYIKGMGAQVITISIQDMVITNRGSAGTCEVDNNRDNFLQIGPVPNITYCSGLINQTPKVYISGRPSVWIRFISNSPGNRVKIHYVKDTVPASQCRNDHFKCNNGKCIPYLWKCNNADECGDRSDETYCTTTTTTTLGPYDCGSNKFMCIDPITHGGVCLHNYLRCNGEVDCQGGEDENNCDTNACGGTIYKPSGYLTSPNYPGPYGEGSRCEWLIQVAQMERIQLQFKNFDLGTKDYVNISDGIGDRSHLIGTFTMSHRPQSQFIQSSHNTMYVVFVSKQRFVSGGHRPVGFNATYQTKERCHGDQIPCGYGEHGCYDVANRCDSIWHCPINGGDERDCYHCRGRNMFQCDTHGSQCYSIDEHCNGAGHCSNKRDEESCNPTVCGPHNGTFLCDDFKCIYEAWRCDGASDCSDHSDEQKCSKPSTKVITAAVIGSLICGLLLVIALGCTCKLYALRLQEHQRMLQHSTPISRIQESIYARRMAPPPYLEAMATSRPFDEMQREASQPQGQSGGRRSRRGRRRSRQGSHDSGVRSVPVQPDSQAVDDVALIDVSGNESSRHCDSPLLVPPNESSSDEEDLNNDSPIEGSNVSISMAAGISAQWRRNPHKISRSSSQHSASDLENVQNLTDITSLDSASASNDSVVIVLNDDSPKVSNTDISQTQQSVPSATNTCHTDAYDNEGLYSANVHLGSDGEDSIVSADVQEDTQPLITS